MARHCFLLNMCQHAKYTDSWLQPTMYLCGIHPGRHIVLLTCELIQTGPLLEADAVGEKNVHVHCRCCNAAGGSPAVLVKACLQTAQLSLSHKVCKLCSVSAGRHGMERKTKTKVCADGRHDGSLCMFHRACRLATPWPWKHRQV